ncbi:MAG: hypothetical protein RIC52_10560 [Amphiplicatus sp.]
MLLFLLPLIAIQIATERVPLPATIEDVREIVESDLGCERSEYPELAMTMYLCEGKFTAWYLTVPDDRLPPGFVRRMLLREGKAIKMVTETKYFGSDDKQNAFLAWQTRIAEVIQ